MVELLGVDGEHGDAAIHQIRDTWPTRGLAGNGNLTWLLDLRAQPVDHGADPAGVLRKRTLHGIAGARLAGLMFEAPLRCLSTGYAGRTFGSFARSMPTKPSGSVSMAISRLLYCQAAALLFSLLALGIEHRRGATPC